MFDSLAQGVMGKLPDFNIDLPKVDVGSFLPDFSTAGDVFSSFGRDKTTSFFGDMARTTGLSLPSMARDNWSSFLPYEKQFFGFNTPWGNKSSFLGFSNGNGQLGYASGEFAVLNQYGSAFLSAGQQFGIDPNLLMAIAMTERGWEGNGTSPAGAKGLMQIMPGGYPEGEQMFPNWMTDPYQNIMLGAYILSQKIKEQGGNIDRGIMGYLGFGGPDAHGTTADVYLQRVKQHLQSLQSSGGSGAYTGTSSGFYAMFGGQQFGISSENGVSNGMPAGWYNYAAGLGLPAGTHTGLDITAPESTKLYLPPGITGVVEIADGLHGYGYDPNGGVAPSGAGTGQLRIKLSNGHYLILGHMKSIYVKSGQYVSGRDYLGMSGIAGSGAHLHLEYRIPDNSTSTGWRSVDPRYYLR